MIYVKVKGAEPILFKDDAAADAATEDMQVIERREATEDERKTMKVAE